MMDKATKAIISKHLLTFLSPQTMVSSRQGLLLHNGDIMCHLHNELHQSLATVENLNHSVQSISSCKTEHGHDGCLYFFVY